MSNQDPIYFLLVDDLSENLLSLEALLRREGLTLLKANSGVEALELLLKYEVSLAFLDVQMPEMDGFELAELMRGNERTRRVPIIFLTAGTADRQRRFRGYETGAVDFLLKPIEPDILRSKAQVFFELSLQRQQLARQRDELKASADALKEADRRKDEFLAVLAHELRNPLAPIRYALDILGMASDEETLTDMRAMMSRQVSHLVRLIDDLLDVSRVSRGKIDLREDYVTLQTALQAATEASQPVIDAGHHTLATKIPEEPLWLFADVTRISQVMSNLLNNAAKYTHPRGRITLSARADGRHVMISVSDSGVGIPAEMLPRVFDLFTQVENGLERSRGGLGIGLALARQLVELHGGTISAESPGVGHGSTFTVTLPLQHREEEAALPTGEPDALAASVPRKILVVDDNASSAEATGRMLSIIGHQTFLAYDGAQALAKAREQRPDVILLDLGMPGLSGHDVCRELRKDPIFQTTVFIAQTGWGQESDRQKTKEAGFDHHLTKPIDIRELARLISSPE